MFEILCSKAFIRKRKQKRHVKLQAYIILTPFSKIFKTLIYGRIHHHLVDNNIVVDEQSSTVKVTHNYLMSYSINKKNNWWYIL
jgi:hypothetical protein